MLTGTQSRAVGERSPWAAVGDPYALLANYSMGSPLSPAGDASADRNRNYKERTLAAIEGLASAASGINVVVVDGERLQLQHDYIGAKSGALCRLKPVPLGTALVAVPLEAGDTAALVNQVLPALPTRKERDLTAVAAVALETCRAYESPTEFMQHISSFYRGLFQRSVGALGGGVMGLLALSSDIPHAIGVLGMLAAIHSLYKYQRSNGRAPSLLLSTAFGFAALTATEAAVGFVAEAILPGISLQIPRAWSAPFLVGGLLLSAGCVISNIRAMKRHPALQAPFDA
jgi:hypothetical protein